MGKFGQVLREIRTERGLTQGQLAYKADTTPEYISMLERSADRTPGTNLLVRLTTALGITPDYVLRRAGILNVSDHAPLDPEVQHIADLLAAWPEGELKGNLRAIITIVGETLEHVLEMLKDEDEKEGCDDQPAI